MRLIKTEDFLNINVLTNLKVSLDQKIGIYTVNVSDLESNAYQKILMLIDIEKQTVSKLELPFEVADYQFDFNKIIFKVSEDKQTRLIAYRYLEKMTEEIVSIPFLMKTFAYDGEFIYFTAEVQNGQADGEIKASEYGPLYKEGQGVVGDSLTGLFKASTDGYDISLITTLDMDVNLIDYDLKNHQIAFTSFKKSKLKSVASDVYTYDIHKESFSVHSEGIYRIDHIKIMSSTHMVFMGVDIHKKSRNDNQQSYLLNLRTGEFERLGDHIDLSNEYPGVITDCVYSTSSPVKAVDDWFYHIRVMKDRNMIFRTHLGGKTEQVDIGLKVVSSYAVLNMGILAIGLRDQNLHEVYFYSKGKLSQLSNHNEWLKDLEITRPSKVEFDYDGLELEGWVLPPRKMKADRLYPGVMLIHGGPKMIYTDVFIYDAQMLSAKGFFVFYMNPQGSDGRGDAFSNIRGRFGNLPFEQMMSFTDQVLKDFPQMDENLLGVTGGSYGGYMTNYIITHTDRFKAAVSERGISNMVTAFTSGDIGYKFVYEYMGNKDLPWENHQAYLEASPISRAGYVSTPTLFIHGKRDYRCHYTESLNMYSALNYLGIDTKICLFEKDNHCLVVKGKPQSRMRRYEEFVGWFEKYLKRGER